MAISATNRVKFKNVSIGDHAYVSFAYTSNNDIRIIPRAKGVKIWSTNELGGGYLSITVTALVAKDSRISLEDYFNDMDSTFGLTTSGTLEIIDGVTTISLSDCFLESFDQESNDAKANTFTMKFVKSL